MRHLTSAAATCCVAVCALPTAAGAETRLTNLPSVRPGERVHLRAITTGSERCRLRLAGRSKTLKVEGFTRSRFTIRVRRRARPGRYPVLLRCDDTSDAAVVRVRGPRPTSARRKIVASISARSYRRPLKPYSRQVTAAWREEKVYNDQFFTEIADEIAWAYRRRPDIVEAVERQAIADALNDDWPEGDVIVTNWEPFSWDDNALTGGLNVSVVPTPGALMVWHRSPVDADLAYVERILPGNAIVVSEIAQPGAAVTRRTISAAARARAFEVVFIHRLGVLGL